ncbi:MAG: hypothetical protein K2X81_08660 [Candidatus Obscuribacterales bacterium]|nr:hypothetical protein [Candidatus Obscuribacterales bacterium]
MKNNIVYVMVAGLAIGILSQASAQADDLKYYKVLSTQSALPTKTDYVPIERAMTFPVVIERTSTMQAVINGTSRPILLEETTSLPVALERTTVAKPHHWPFTFGVWP